MVISIINCTDGTLSDEEIMQAIRAINRQIKQDFEPYWSFGASLRLEGLSGKKPQAQRLEDLRGDAVIYRRLVPRADSSALRSVEIRL